MRASPITTFDEAYEQHLLSAIVKHTNNAVIITDLEGQIIYTNEGFTNITGYTLGEVFGQKPGDFLQGPETNMETVLKIRDQLKRLERVNETILNYHKDGHQYWLQLDIYPLFDDLNVATHFMAIESLVTEMKEKELLVEKQAVRLQENISYAQKLQDALFRKNGRKARLFDEFFILDLPKDKVGGDFYLIDQIQNRKVVLLGDCTGHGASGAMLTAMCVTAIKELLRKYKTLSPAMIINKAQEQLTEMLENGSKSLRDNLEATLVFVNEEKQEIKFASTNQELYLMHETVHRTIKNRRSFQSKSELTDQTIFYEKGAMLYLGSDGLKDQFGGEKSKKFTSKRISDLLSTIHIQRAEDQKAKLRETYKVWRGAEDQTDDILLLGVRL